MANKWSNKTPLRQMTEDYNQTVEELEELKQSSSQVNQATEKRFTELEQSVEEQFNQVSEELNQKVESVTAEDIGLGSVDNTSDMDKPVSTAQSEAIALAKSEAMKDMLTSEEEEVVTGDDPEVNPVLISLISSIVQEILAEEGAADYGIASELVLGVVKASGDIQVDSVTGKMSIPGYTNLKDTVQSLVSGVGSLEQLSTTSKDNIVNAVNELFQSVSSGKELVASAITDRGVATEPTATFSQMSQNIQQLQVNVEDKYLFHIPDEEYSTYMENLLYPFQDGQIAFYNGEVHIMGGIVNAISYGTRHSKWNGTKWETITTIPTSFTASKAVVVTNGDGNQEIHLLGGCEGNWYKHYKYDGISWTSVGELPIKATKGLLASVTQDSNGKDVINILYNSEHYIMRYGAKNYSWTKVADLPHSVNRAHADCEVFENEIYVLCSPSTTTCYFYKLTGDNWELSQEIFEPVQILDYSPLRSSKYVDLNTTISYPHLIVLKELNMLLLFTDFCTGSKVTDKTYVLSCRPNVDSVWDMLFATEEGGSYQGGELMFDESKRILYSVGGAYLSDTQTHFRMINYEIYAKLT